MNENTAKSVIFKNTDSKTSPSKLSKLSAKKSATFEQKRKSADDQLSNLTFYDLLKTVTHCESLKIVESKESNTKTILTAEEEEHLAHMLGKRAKPETKLTEEDNPVSQVDFIEIDKIKTTSKEKSGLSRTVTEEEDRQSLPQSVRERYQTHKKRDEKLTNKKEESKRESSTLEAPKQPNKWSELYGEASKQIGKLIDKQSERLQAREEATNSKDKKGQK